MATVEYLPSEDQFLCPICLDVFTDPVTTSCGHNFCKDCLNAHWNTHDQYKCPMCEKVFDTRPELHVNIFIAQMAAQFRQSAQQKAGSSSSSSSSSTRQQASKTGEVPCDICTGTKQQALKSCLVCLVSYCETHLAPHLTTSGLRRHRLIDPVANLEDRMCLKHDKPLELFCKTDQMCVCMLCSVLDHKTHEFVPLKQGYEEKKATLWKTEAEVQLMIQKRQLKIQEIKESVDLSKENADREIAEGVQVFTSLKESVEKAQVDFIDTVKERQELAEKQAEGFIKELEEEISGLMKRSSELETLSHCEDHLHLLQTLQSLNTNHPTASKNWAEMSISTGCQGTMMRAVNQLEETLRAEMKKPFIAELKRVQQYEVDITFDPDTAHPNLTLSDDGKQVKQSAKSNVPDIPERFTLNRCVLGKPGLSLGRYYYEVQVEGKNQWELGIVSQSINRKTNMTVSYLYGKWSICLKDGDKYTAFDAPSVCLSLKSRPQKVGVFVDYEEGFVSFYDVDAAARMYSFTGCNFTEKLLPFFRVFKSEGVNSAPIIICPVSED